MRHPAPGASFPTRRSSDLRGGERDREARPPAVGLQQEHGRGRGEKETRDRTTAPEPDRERHEQRQAEPRPQGAEPAEPLLDRKSTRLNSSHLVISYAVFCL